MKSRTGIQRIAAESITNELLVSELYMEFSRRYQEDSEFWRTLAEEEEHHAVLIEGGQKNYLPSDDLFPRELLSKALLPLLRVQNKLMIILNEFATAPPDKEIAYNIATKIEDTIGESCFQGAIEQVSPSASLLVYQELNSDCREHSKRIRDYMQCKGIPELVDVDI